jgi:hypothetical protein
MTLPAATTTRAAAIINAVSQIRSILHLDWPQSSRFAC